MKPHRFAIPKSADLDVLLSLALFDYSPDDELIPVSDEYTQRLPFIQDHTIICIEIGGSGDIEHLNFDHHAYDNDTPPHTIPNESACMQIWKYLGSPASWAPYVRYVDTLDRLGPDHLGPPPDPPTLSGVISGMMLLAKDEHWELERIVDEGVIILRTIYDKQIDPFGTIRGFEAFAHRKKFEEEQIQKALQKARWFITHSGKKLGVLETTFRGATGILYQHGADYVIIKNPDWIVRTGEEPVVKYTIAGKNELKVNQLLKEIEKQEKGWGGPASGTIIGSPFPGSNLEIDYLITLLINHL